MADQSTAKHYVKRYALVRRGGIAASGKPMTRMAFIDRVSRDGESLRARLLNIGGRSHGTFATKNNVTVEPATIEADWPAMPSQAEIKRAKQSVGQAVA